MGLKEAEAGPYRALRVSFRSRSLSAMTEQPDERDARMEEVICLGPRVGKGKDLLSAPLLYNLVNGIPFSPL